MLIQIFLMDIQLYLFKVWILKIVLMSIKEEMKIVRMINLIDGFCYVC